MPAEPMDNHALWLTAMSRQIRALLEGVDRVDETTATTQDLVRPLGQLLDLLARPDDQAQELGSSLAEALKQMASSLRDIEVRQAVLVEDSDAMKTQLSSMEATLARSEVLLGRMARLLLSDDAPSPSA